VRSAFNKSCFLCDLVKRRKIQRQMRPELNTKEMKRISGCTADVDGLKSNAYLFV
jgi:hypothetical protein